MIEDPHLLNVRRRAGLPSAAAAVEAIRATLHTLAERLSAGDALRLWQVLPASFAGVVPAEPPPPAGGYSFDEFCQRLADRGQHDVPVAVFRARTVLQVLREAAPDLPEWQLIPSHLTNDFAPLFWQPATAGAAA